MKKYLFLFAFIYQFGIAQEKTTWNTAEVTVSPILKGNLYTPEKASSKTDLVIIIAGSGPTDRNGNVEGLKNNSLKYLSEALAANNIAAFSYDKRIIAQMALGTVDEKTLLFQDFIDDAKTVINYFRGQKKFRHIIVAGHSEGSLIGMVAGLGIVDGYISIAGPGRSIDQVIEEQLKGQTQDIKDEARGYFTLLKQGKTFELKNPVLGSLFRPSIQPYMISWMKYDPAIDIQKLKIPVLIINGTKDLQIKPADAQLLGKAQPNAKVVIIENMNHVFKDVTGDDAANFAAYSNPDLPINKQLIAAVISFVNSI